MELALRAGWIGTGDEVITVAHTAVATVCASRIEGLVKRIMAFSGSDAGGRQRLDLVQCVSGALAEQRRTLPAHIALKESS